MSSRTIRVSQDVYRALQAMREPGERNFNGAIMRALARWGGAAPAEKLAADYEAERARRTRLGKERPGG